MSAGPFNVGDVVVCIDNGPNRLGVIAPMLKIGKIYRITSFLIAPSGYRDAGMTSVMIEGVRSRTEVGAFAPERFRHLPKADEQFIAEMRAIRPAKNPERV